MKKLSIGEETFALQLRAHKLTDWDREVLVCADRKFRFDFANRLKMLAIEVDGAIHTAGRHSRGSGVLGDMEKGNLAAVMGWKFLRFSTEQVKSGEAIAFVLEHFYRECDA